LYSADAHAAASATSTTGPALFEPAGSRHLEPSGSPHPARVVPPGPAIAKQPDTPVSVMNAFTTWLTRRNPLLTDAQRRRCERLPRAAALSVAPLNTQRFVVVDVETTGLNLHRDQVLSIGAVVIDQGAIHFAEQ